MTLENLTLLRQATIYQRLKARAGKIVFLQDDTRPGWSGSAPFYLFRCPNKLCVNHERLAVDYAHGFKNYNERITCPDCGANKYFPLNLKHELSSWLNLLRALIWRPQKLLLPPPRPVLKLVPREPEKKEDNHD